MDRRSSVPVLAALVAPVVVCALLVPVREYLTSTNAALLLVLVVVAVAATGRRLAGVLAALSSTLAFEGPPADRDRPRLLGDGVVEHHGRALDVDRYGLPTMDAVELDVRSAGCHHGRYLLVASTAVRRPDRESRLVAVTLAEQVASALAGGLRASG